MGSFGCYGFLVGGSSSGSKYSLYRYDARAVSQLVSYEVSLALAVIGVVMMSQTLSLTGIVDAQQHDGSGTWCRVRQLRDLPTGVDGQGQPYPVRPARGRGRAGGRLPHRVRRHALRHVRRTPSSWPPIAFSALASILFLGGYDGPFLPGPVWMLLKMALFLFLFIWMRADAAPRTLRPAHDPSAGRCCCRRATLNLHRHRGRRGLRVGLRISHGCRRSRSRASASPSGTCSSKPVTQQYPEYKRPVYPRFRGRHLLHRHENGLEKCVGCSLCAAACPADCIRVVACGEHSGGSATRRASGMPASTRST